MELGAKKMKKIHSLYSWNQTSACTKKMVMVSPKIGSGIATRMEKELSKTVRKQPSTTEWLPNKDMALHSIT